MNLKAKEVENIVSMRTHERHDSLLFMICARGWLASSRLILYFSYMDCTLALCIERVRGALVRFVSGGRIFFSRSVFVIGFSVRNSHRVGIFMSPLANNSVAHLRR